MSSKDECKCHVINQKYADYYRNIAANTLNTYFKLTVSIVEYFRNLQLSLYNNT